MINVYKKILSILIIFNLAFTLVSCKSNKLVNYDIKVEDKEIEAETKEFTFERSMDQGYLDRVVTQKDNDKLVNDKILSIIKNRKKKPVKMHGIYLPAYVAGNEEKFDKIFENIINSNINAIIVDVKDELGRITVDITGDNIKRLKTREMQIKNTKDFLQKCHDNNIYVVARIASFLDNFAPRQDKNLAVLKKDGTYYKDNSGYFWLNPYKKEVQDYILEIGLACADIGFDEIQYDYFRFSADRGMNKVDFSDVNQGKNKIEILTSIAKDHYLKYIEKDVFFSLDVFGGIINSYKDQFSIGQDYNSLVKYCDYICPMVYPSHYANKTFGIDIPDLEPYNTVFAAMKSSKTSIENQYDNTAHYGDVRPWLQAFTANYIPEYLVYDPEQYKEQIKAVEDSGYEEWIFWQGGGVYKWDAFLNSTSTTANNNE